MNLTISIFHISAARKLLTRLRFERFTLPVLTHVLATIVSAGLTLAVTDFDHWLETRVPATIQVPVTTKGQPPEIAFEPKHLADALEIGCTLRLADKLNPGMTSDPSGNFCVVMSARFTEETVNVEATSETPVHAMAA